MSHFSALSIIGTWSVQSMVRETGVGQRRHEFGSKPSGYISYLPDGRMHAILVAEIASTRRRRFRRETSRLDCSIP